MSTKVKTSDAVAINAVLEELVDLDDEAAIEAEYQEHKANLESSLAHHEAARDKKLADLASLRTRHAQVATDTGVDLKDVGGVNLAKSEILTKAEAG